MPRIATKTDTAIADTDLILKQPSSGSDQSATFSRVWTWIKSKFSNDRASFLGYKEYIAHISQSGTNHPIETVVFQNDFTNTPDWTRYSTGNYGLKILGELTESKKIVFVSSLNSHYCVPLLDAENDHITIQCFDRATDTNVDSNNFLLKVRVYD